MNYRGDLLFDKIYVMEIDQQTTDYHTHDFYEMAYIVKGSITHILGGKEYTVHQGDYFIIDIDTRHRYIKLNNTSCQLINCLFYPEFIDKTLKYCKSFSNIIENYLIKFEESILRCNPTLYIFRDEDKSILESLEKIKKEVYGRKHGYTEYIRCILVEILISTMRKIISEERYIKKISPTEYIINYVKEEYNQKILLSEISKSLNYSLSYISLRFKDDTGFVFSEYLQKYRIDQSCRLLANTDKKIQEISSLVGYEDVKFFGQLFKRYMHISPSGFRKTLKQAKNV